MDMSYSIKSSPTTLPRGLQISIPFCDPGGKMMLVSWSLYSSKLSPNNNNGKECVLQLKRQVW